MKIKTSIIAFPGSTGINDIKDACEFFEWEYDVIWYKDLISRPYDMIFLPGGIPFEKSVMTKEELLNCAPVLNNLQDIKALKIGFSEGFKTLCELELLKGKLYNNISGKRISAVKEFSFLDKDVYLPMSTMNGNFVKNSDFSEDIVLKYSDNKEISDNSIAGIFDYENKVIGMVAHPERAVLPKLRMYDGRKVFEFFKNVI